MQAAELLAVRMRKSVDSEGRQKEGCGDVLPWILCICICRKATPNSQLGWHWLTRWGVGIVEEVCPLEGAYGFQVSL